MNVPAENASIPAATLGLAIILAQDGVAPMNNAGDSVNERIICPTTDPTPGCDFSEHNAIVRTHDSVIYTYDYNVNGGDATDIIIKAIAPFGVVWEFTPGFCLGDGPPTGDGISAQSTITCHRGPQPTGTAESLPFVATILGDRPNGAILTTIGILSDGPSGPPVFAGSPQVTVSAAPWWNLRKTFHSISGNNTAGYNIQYTMLFGVYDNYPFADALNPRYGSSALNSPITFKDKVSDISPNATLEGSCVAGTYPGTAGSVVCSQPGGPGTPIEVTITGANTTLDQYTVPPSDNVFGVGGYGITIHIPPSDVPPGGRPIVNELIDFDPVSIAGQSNFGALTERPFDNTVANTVVPPTSGPGNGFFRKRFVDFASGGVFGFDDFVAPNQIFASQFFLFNDTGAPLTNAVMCDVMDISKYKVIETSPGSGIVHTMVAGTPTRVEFATGYVNAAGWLPSGPGGNPSGLITECTDASVPWSTTLPADPSLITKFRVVYEGANVLPPGGEAHIRVRVQARDTDSSNQPIPAGSTLANFGIWRSDEKNPGYVTNTFWQHTYPNQANGTLDYGARLTLARATVRISKETENNNMTDSIETGSGNGIGFVLKPVVNPMPVPGGPVTVIVTDVLPLGLIYTQGSSSIPPPQPTQTTCGALPLPPPPSCTDPAQQVLIWTFTNVTPGTPMTPITFRATADLTVLTNEPLTNTVIVSSPADASADFLRTATRTIFGAAPSTFLIYKSSSVPQIDVNGSFSYTVSYRNASFLTDFSGMDFIDVLPFAGDNSLPFGSGTHTRNPASAFSGGINLSSITAAGSLTWYFSNAPPASINISPKHSSNLNPGTGPLWCPGTAAGPDVGCGFTLGQATAVRVQDTAVMPRNNTVRTFTLNFTTTGNVANNVYTNNSGGSVNEILLPVSSINVPVTVRDGKISGLVWYDTNGDGIRDPAETGRVGSSLVTLTGPVNATQTTGPSGTYSFNGLPGGSYTVKFTKPINYRTSPQDQGGSDTTDSDGDPVTLIATVPALGAAATTVDQGFYQLSLRGTVWNDGNSSGDQGGFGEDPIATPIFDLELLDDQGAVARKTQTTGGQYVFVNLPAGDYKVRMTTNSIPVSPVFHPDPNDDVDRDNNGMQETVNTLISNTISLAPGTEPEIDHTNGTTVNRTLDFGLFLQPTAAGVAVGGRVLTAGGRGIGKTLVTLTGPGGTVQRALTNPFGYYRFDNVAAGTTVLISVSSKSHTFEIGTRVVSVGDELLDVNFIAIE